MKVLFVVFVIFCLAISAMSAPPQQLSSQRQKRVSDQRLAELETLLALARMKNRKYMSLPVGFGLIDVQKIGRKKRSTLSPMSQLLFPRNYPEFYQKGELLPVKGVDTPLRGVDEVGSSFVYPVIEDALQGWDGREPRLALVQDNA